ncbi:MAG: type IV pilus assembly protein PilE [Oceanicoccus sp.]|jgi:type IV pilus assembly protein PilE
MLINTAPKSSYTGFSLIELIIAIAIVGILAAAALPSYTSYLLKGKRSDGYGLLNEIMQAQERFAVDTGSYTTTLSQLGYSVDSFGKVESAEGNFRLSAAACATGTLTQCILLTAEAQDNQVNDENGNSGDISLNSRGTKNGW